ncbi:protein OPY2 [Microdochium nivale]|nr:protein OPY2 [Microdochium nivale]
MHIDTMTTLAARAATGSDGTCITGGPSLSWPATPPWGSSSEYVYIAGNDTEAPAFKECCGKFPVQHMAPCTLWCETDAATFAGLRKCWRARGFEPHYVSGLSVSDGSGGNGLRPGDIAVGVVGALAAVGLVGAVVLWWCLRKEKGSACGKNDRAGGGVETVTKEARDKEEELRYSSDGSSMVSGTDKV